MFIHDMLQLTTYQLAHLESIGDCYKVSSLQLAVFRQVYHIVNDATVCTCEFISVIHPLIATHTTSWNLLHVNLMSKEKVTDK